MKTDDAMRIIFGAVVRVRWFAAYRVLVIGDIDLDAMSAFGRLSAAAGPRWVEARAKA